MTMPSKRAKAFPAADLGLRHPLLESGPVQVEIWRKCRPSHVRNNIMFINNEQLLNLNMTDWLVDCMYVLADPGNRESQLRTDSADAQAVKPHNCPAEGLSWRPGAAVSALPLVPSGAIRS